MGDLVEFITKSNLGAVFYKITTGGFKFSIKKLYGRAAAIILSTTPTIEHAYWIVLGLGNTCYIHTRKRTHSFNVPDLLREEYRDLWIAWNDGSIRLGQDGDLKPLFVKKIKERNLLYVTFFGTSRETQLKWKINLPPQVERPCAVKLNGGTPRWVQPDDQLPDDAIIGGYENESLYIIRAKHQGSLTPGKFVPSQGVGYLAWGGGMHEKNDFEVLCGYNYKWVRSQNDVIPFGAVVAGFSEDYRHENLYVGRVKCDNHVIPGKIQPTHKVCYVAYNDKEIANSTFETLVVPFSNVHNEQEYYMAHCGNINEFVDRDNYSDSDGFDYVTGSDDE